MSGLLESTRLVVFVSARKASISGGCSQWQTKRGIASFPTRIHCCEIAFISTIPAHGQPAIFTLPSTLELHICLPLYWAHSIIRSWRYYKLYYHFKFIFKITKTTYNFLVPKSICLFYCLQNIRKHEKVEMNRSAIVTSVFFNLHHH